MTLPNQPLILDLLEWVELRPRTYAEALAAWRTSCPRLTIWEDATDAGLLIRDGITVRLTPDGQSLLEQHRPARWRQAAGSSP